MDLHTKNAMGFLKSRRNLTSQIHLAKKARQSLASQIFFGKENLEHLVYLGPNANRGALGVIVLQNLFGIKDLSHFFC